MGTVPIALSRSLCRLLSGLDVSADELAVMRRRDGTHGAAILA